MSFSELMASFAAKTGIETDGSRGGAAFRYEDLIILLQEAGDLLLLRTDLGFIEERIWALSTRMPKSPCSGRLSRQILPVREPEEPSSP